MTELFFLFVIPAIRLCPWLRQGYGATRSRNPDPLALRSAYFFETGAAMSVNGTKNADSIYTSGRAERGAH